MYNYFYNFHKRPLGWNLFSRDTQDGTPSPPGSQSMETQTAEKMVTQTSIVMITE